MSAKSIRQAGGRTDRRHRGHSSRRVKTGGAEEKNCKGGRLPTIFVGEDVTAKEFSRRPNIDFSSPGARLSSSRVAWQQLLKRGERELFVTKIRISPARPRLEEFFPFPWKREFREKNGAVAGRPLERSVRRTDRERTKGEARSWKLFIEDLLLPTRKGVILREARLPLKHYGIGDAQQGMYIISYARRHAV